MACGAVTGRCKEASGRQGEQAIMRIDDVSGSRGGLSGLDSTAWLDPLRQNVIRQKPGADARDNRVGGRGRKDRDENGSAGESAARMAKMNVTKERRRRGE